MGSFFSKSFALAVVLSLGSASAFAFGRGLKEKRPDAAPTILAAFQGSCSSQGAQTAAANAQTSNLIGIIETLKQTDACKPYAAELTQISSAAAQLQALQKDPSYTTYSADQNQLQILTRVLLDTDPSSPVATQLQSTIETVRGQMYADEAVYDATKQSLRSDLIASQSQSIMSFGQQLVTESSAPGLAQCLSQSPAAAIQMTSNLMAYGGAFLPTVYGAGTSALAALINIGTEIFKDGQYDRAISRAQADEMPDALNCALESMSDSYCAADDSYSLLELVRENRDANYIASPLWKGIDILGRQLPGLVAWLNQIQNGVPPQDSFQASKQTNVLSEVFQVKVGDLQAVSAINNSIAQYNATSDNTIRVANMVATISSSALSAAGFTGAGASTGSSPFSTLQPSPYVWACWLTYGYFDFNGTFGGNCPNPVGVNPSNAPPTSLILTNYVNQLTNGGTAIPQIVPSLIQNWESVVAKVEDLVNTDFARTITTDAGALISDAFEPSGGHPLSPRAVLGNISDFIQSMIDYHYLKNPQLAEELVIEKAKVDAAVQQLDGTDDAICPPSPPPVFANGHPNPAPSVSPSPAPAPPGLSPAQCQNKRLIRLFEIFGLQDGAQVFSTAVQNLVNIDLQNRFISGEFPTNKTDILKAAGTDLYIRLQEAGLGDLDPITSDLNNARADFETNIRAFRQFFVNSFEGAVEHEASLIVGEDPQAGPNRPHGQKLGQLCMFWLMTSNIPGSAYGTTANWPSLRTQQICEQAAYYNGNDNADTSGNFTPAFVVTNLEQTIGQSSFEKRICTFHKFKIKNEADTLYSKNATPAPH